MAKVTAPLLSFDAAGQIGTAQVYAKWRGRAYARRYVSPSNPQSVEQTKTRTVFAYLSALWKFAPALAIAPWDAFAAGQPFTGRNAFIGQNTSVLRGETDSLLLIGSPGAKGGIPPAAIAVAAGNDLLTVTLTAPALPTGWTIQAGIAWAVRVADPQSSPPTLYESVAVEDLTSTYVISVTGLASAAQYIVNGWFRYTKADGSTAYGPSLSDDETTT